MTISPGPYLPNIPSIRQDHTALLVSLFSPSSNFFIGPATDRVVPHRKLVFGESQRPRDIPPRRFERVRTNDQRRFLVVFKGNAVMHTAR